MAKKADTPNFEALNSELETVLAELQRSDISVDDALKHYQRGLELIEALGNYLESAETKIKELKGQFNTSP